MDSPLDTLPIHFIGPALLVSLVLIAEVGFRLRQRGGTNGETAYAASATVSLLALLISFTFSVALNRYDTRREMVVEEAAAVGMVWQRARLLEAPARVAVEDRMRAYVDRRLAYFQGDRPTDRSRPSDSAGRHIRLQLWDVADDLNDAGAPPLMTRALIDALTRLDDAAAKRESIAREHIPLLVIEMLLVFSLIAAATLGYTGAIHGTVTRAANWAFFLLVSLAISLVLDLDRPRSGLVTVSQLPMHELDTIMDAPIGTEARAGLDAPPRSAREVLKP